MNIKKVNIDDIKPMECNPRVTLTKEDFEYNALKKSVDTFGLVSPLIINARTGNLVSGHQRLNVLKEKGEKETEAVIIDVSESEEKALCIALNKIKGVWDYGKLSMLIQELSSESVDMEVTGLQPLEIKELLGELDGDIDVDFGETNVNLEDDQDDVKCVIGEYTFYMAYGLFYDCMADVKEKVGFSKAAIEMEMKRRLLRED